jgi:hypothetical protein
MEERRLNPEERRKSQTDARSIEDRLCLGDRRSRILRRSSDRQADGEQPSKEHLSLVSKRIRRAMREETCRHIFGVTSAEHEFVGHADVLRTLEWIDKLVGSADGDFSP